MPHLTRFQYIAERFWLKYLPKYFRVQIEIFKIGSGATKIQADWPLIGEILAPHPIAQALLLLAAMFL